MHRGKISCRWSECLDNALEDSLTWNVDSNEGNIHVRTILSALVVFSDSDVVFAAALSAAEVERRFDEARVGRDIVFPASHAKFTIYSYTPNFEGQESVEVDYDGVKLYPFALLRCVIPSIPPKYEYLMYKTSNDKPELVSIVNSVCSSIKRGTMSDRNGHPMLKFEEAKENGHIDIEVAKGTDPLQAIAIGISIDEETTRSK